MVFWAGALLLFYLLEQVLALNGELHPVFQKINHILNILYQAGELAVKAVASRLSKRW